MSGRLDVLVGLSRCGSVDELALVVGLNAGVSRAKLLRLTGLSGVALDELLSLVGFRRRVSEVLALSRVSPGVEAGVLDRFVGVVSDGGSSFGEFRAAADWLLGQGGLRRAERSLEVGHEHRVVVEFRRAPDESLEGYEAPDALAGVSLGGPRAELEEGVEDAEFEVVGVGGEVGS